MRSSWESDNSPSDVSILAILQTSYATTASVRPPAPLPHRAGARPYPATPRPACRHLASLWVLLWRVSCSLAGPRRHRAADGPQFGLPARRPVAPEGIESGPAARR